MGDYYPTFKARACAPFVHGLRSGVRVVLWQVQRFLLRFPNLVVTGGGGAEIWTCVFLATAEKPL